MALLPQVGFLRVSYNSSGKLTRTLVHVQILIGVLKIINMNFQNSNLVSESLLTNNNSIKTEKSPKFIEF